MSIKDMMAAVDEEIARLQLIRKLLSGDSGATSNGVHSRVSTGRKVLAKGKRVLSAEARERIASAQRKRWAAAKRAGKKVAK